MIRLESRALFSFNRWLVPLQIGVMAATVSIAQNTQAQSQTVGPAVNNLQLSNTFSYADLLKLRSVQDVKISPDGRRIAFVLSSVDSESDKSTESIWFLRTADRALTQLTASGSSSPAWSPDGKQLAIVAADSGGSVTIELFSPDKPDVRRRFHIPSQPGSLTWSPDGRSIAMSMFVPERGAKSFLQQAVDHAELSLERRLGARWAAPISITQAARYQSDGSGYLTLGNQHIFVLSTQSGDLRQVTSGSSDDADPSWLPDNSGLLFASDRRSEPFALVRVPAVQKLRLSDDSVVQLSRGTDYVENPTASPDGRWIAYTSHEEHHVNYSPSNLYLMRADGGAQKQLAPRLDRDVYGTPQWSADSRSVYASFIDHGLARVGKFSINGGMKEVAFGTDLGFSMSLTGDLAYAGSSTDRPAEVNFKAADGRPKTLTTFNDFLQERRLGRLVHLETPSSFDGVPVESWILLPPGAQPHTKLPTIVELHGGPFGFDDPGWSSEMQLYAAAGYAVIFTNYRGSTSYGYKFSEPANSSFPGCAYSDVMSVVDAFIQQDFVDPNRLFVTGSSAGGELTTWIIGKTNRFHAAVAYKPVINHLSNYLESDQYLQGALILTPPWLLNNEYWATSPLSLVGSVSTPTLLITGDQDKRTPLTETLQFYNALQLRRVPSALITVPGASHESLRSRPSQLAAETAATLAWFKHYDPGQK